MTSYMAEEQQIELVRQWWKKYGVTTLLSLAVAIIAVFLWRHYQEHRERLLEHASARYEQLLTSIVNNDQKLIAASSNRLLKHYSKTPYAQLAELVLARQAVYAGDLENGLKRLQWIIEHSHDSPLRQVARLRAARIFLEQKHPQAALDLLNKIDDPAYRAAIEEVRGDASQMLGDRQTAARAYHKALQILPGIEITRPLLQMKADALSILEGI